MYIIYIYICIYVYIYIYIYIHMLYVCIGTSLASGAIADVPEGARVPPQRLLAVQEQEHLSGVGVWFEG